jgi:hypothetical protein
VVHGTGSRLVKLRGGYIHITGPTEYCRVIDRLITNGIFPTFSFNSVC